LNQNTIVCGQYQGFVDVLRITKTKTLAKVIEQKLAVGNIYKIIKTERPDEYAFGCGNGMFFAIYDNGKF